MKKNDILPFLTKAVIAVGVDCLAYFGTRLITTDLPHTNISTALDQKLPFLPWMLIIYYGCYITWVLYYAISLQAKEGSLRFLTAHCIGEIVCLIVYIVFPTTMVRQEVFGPGFFDQFVYYLYQFDPPDNLLPSIHCFVSWMCWLGARNNKALPKWMKTAALVVAILVCISTLGVKQHVIADVFAGILLAEVSYLLAGRIIKDNR